MGAWGEGAFDNDDAADWSAQFDGLDAAAGLRLIDDALAASTIAVAEYLEAGTGAEAVAAAELVAFIRGRPGAATSYNETPRRWIETARPQPGSSLADRAQAALGRVTNQNSELAELWDEAGPEWRASIASLEARLRD